jgi:hypothetical protein
LAYQYVFKEGPLIIKNARQADPERLGKAVAKLKRQHGDHLDKPALRAGVQQARGDPKNPFHPHLEWDDKIAGEAFRVEQLGEIVRLVYIVDDATNQPPQRAFISIREPQHGISYKTPIEVKTNVDFQQLLLDAAWRDLDAFCKRYDSLTEICEQLQIAKGLVEMRIQQLRRH